MKDLYDQLAETTSLVKTLSQQLGDLRDKVVPCLMSVWVCVVYVIHNLVKSRVQLILTFVPDLPHLQKTEGGWFGECYYMICGTADITSSSHRDISKKKKNVSDVLIRAENRVVSQLLE